MSKIRDQQWAEEMRENMPPVRYSLTVTEAFALTGMSDPLCSVAAAYNYGFTRGRNFERNAARSEKKEK